MDAKTYQTLALRTESIVDKPLDAKMFRALHSVFGLTTEVGELADQLKKHLYYGRPLDKVNILEECGDILWYLPIILDAFGYSLDDCMKRNISKLQIRYPQKFTPEEAVDRDLVAERSVLEGNG